MRATIYNFVSGAGGDAMAASRHNAVNVKDKMDKTNISPGLCHILKSTVQYRTHDFYDAIMELPKNDFYVTHHLNLLTPSQLEDIAKIFTVINIDDSHAHRETFLLRLFKNEMRRFIGSNIITVDKKIYYFATEDRRSVVEMWNEISGTTFPDNLVERVDCMVDEYCKGKGLFYEQHKAWHAVRYPGEYVKYERKKTLGTYYLHGHYWNLDRYRVKMELYPPN